MGKLTQDGQIGELTTPLGKDVLVLTQFTGIEGLGELFEFGIDALSEEENIDFDQALGKSCTVKLKAYKGKVRVSVALFGRPTSVELDYLQLKAH